MSIVWSPSAIISARTCLQQWYLMYGAGRRPELDDKRLSPENLSFGVVMHAGAEAAYRCARRGLLQEHHPGTMDRFLGEAITALESRWRSLLLPEDDASQAQMVAELGNVLESLPIPHPAAILAVEEQIDFTGRAGTPFKAILDVVLRTGHEEIHIRDWKRRSISSLPKARELLDDVQLCQQRVAAQKQWPWAQRVTVGLFSTISCAEVSIELPLERALYRLDGHEVTAHRTETAAEYPPKPGQACASCRVRPQCPVFAT